MKKALFSTLFLLTFSTSYAVENNTHDIKYTPKEIIKHVKEFENNFFSEEQIKKRKIILHRLSNEAMKNKNNREIYPEEYKFIFHTLKNNLGTEKFKAGFECIIDLDKESEITWVKILNCFPSINANNSYSDYFPENFLTKINISDETYISENGKYFISFKIKRDKGTKSLNIPYTIQYEDTVEHGEIISSNKEELFKIPVKPGAVSLYIDKYYTISRELSEKEITPTIQDLLTSDSIIYISELDNFDLLEKFKNIKYRITPGDILFKNIENEDLIIDGFDNKFSKLIIDKIPASKNSSEFIALKNPFNEKKKILIINNPKPQNIRILDQYSSYQSLIFKDSDLLSAENSESEEGILVFRKSEDTVIRTKDSLTIKDVINYGENSKVLFIGEHHNNYAHHINQLEIIQNIYKVKPNISIGLEMIQKKYQPVLNSYIAGKITDRELLEKTNYFENWGYDFTLYSPIFKFAQNNKIPLVALNINRDITKKIFNGHYDNITSDEWLELPKKMNILNKKYKNSLEEFFKLHPNSNNKFNNFYLAQNIWDEIMAQNILEFLDSNNNSSMIVLAGSGHLGKTTGIPLRFKRISGNDSTVILQDEEVTKSDADFVIMTKNIEVLGAPKLGIIVYTDEQHSNVVQIKDIEKNSPAYNAKLKVEDIITKCNNYPINNLNDLKITLYEKAYNSTIKCNIKRKNTTKEYVIKLEDYNNSDNIINKHNQFKEDNSTDKGLNKVEIIDNSKKKTSKK